MGFSSAARMLVVLGRLVPQRTEQQRSSGSPWTAGTRCARPSPKTKLGAIKKCFCELLQTIHMTKCQIKRSLEDFIFSEEDKVLFYRSSEVYVVQRKCLTKAQLIAAIQATHMEDHCQSETIYKLLHSCFYWVVWALIAKLGAFMFFLWGDKFFVLLPQLIQSWECSCVFFCKMTRFIALILQLFFTHHLFSLLL